MLLLLWTSESRPSGDRDSYGICGPTLYAGIAAQSLQWMIMGDSSVEVALETFSRNRSSALTICRSSPWATRPLSDGGLSVADIRGPAAPEHYAYELKLNRKLRLRQPDPGHIEVYYWEYGVTASVITAEQAHDVIGSLVPTHLSISGPEKVTLTVEHRAESPAGGSFQYPVLGGYGWQGGYYLASFEMNEPLPPAESQEEEELEEEGVAVDASAESVNVSIMGFGPQHVTYSGGPSTPPKGWARYICSGMPVASGRIRSRRRENAHSAGGREISRGL